MTVGDRVTGAIGPGLVVLIGIAPGDGRAEASWLIDKVANLRIFGDETGRMNRCLREVAGAALVVSQFTLYGDARRGRRPSFAHAARGERAEAVYEKIVRELERAGIETATGEFGATMSLTLTNEGPVTILLDSDKTF